MKRILPYLLLTSILAMTACDEKKDDKGLNSDTYLEEYEKAPSWEELLADSIVVKEHVGKECAVICNNLDIATDRLTHVLSPDGLISAKKMYLMATNNLSTDMKGLTNHEISMVKSHQAEADKAYRKACQEYEVPASGVIANLNDMIKGLRNLDHVHLCVEQNDKKNISEVKRLALTLKNLYESKKHELGMK